MFLTFRILIFKLKDSAFQSFLKLGNIFFFKIQNEKKKIKNKKWFFFFKLYSLSLQIPVDPPPIFNNITLLKCWYVSFWSPVNQFLFKNPCPPGINKRVLLSSALCIVYHAGKRWHISAIFSILPYRGHNVTISQLI